MKRFNIATSIYLALAFCIVQLAVIAEETHDWKETNSRAIAAMRNEKYAESEKLFQQALEECQLPEDRRIVNTNLSLLMQKLGKVEEARQLKGEVETTLDLSKKENQVLAPSHDMRGATLRDQPEHSTRHNGIRATIQQLDAEIAEADKAGNLDKLQALFARKAEALKIRDGAETLDYAYALHFRAQVLHHMHKIEEADAIETRAMHIRDTIRMLSSEPIHSPTKSRSRLSTFDIKFDHDQPPPSNYQESYPSASSGSTISNSMRNQIDRNTTNIQRTPGAGATLNNERNFGH